MVAIATNTMSRFLEKSQIKLAKGDASEANYPFTNLYATKEEGRLFINMEAVPTLLQGMKSDREIGVIIDMSGSMSKHYKDKSVERMISEVVESLKSYDGDGIDLYFYAASLVYSATVRSKQDVSHHIDQARKARGAFGTTMPVMAFEKFASQLKEKGKNGTVIFLTDGGMDDRGVKMKRFYQDVLHKDFRTRDRFYCYAIEFGSGASGALKVLDGLYPPEQGLEDLFDIHKTNSLSKLSEVLQQVVGMSSISSNREASFSTNNLAKIEMINQYLLPKDSEHATVTAYKTMSIGVSSGQPFVLQVNVNGYSPMNIQVTPTEQGAHLTLEHPVQTNQPLSLSKGQKVSLSKIEELEEIQVGLGWDVSYDHQEFDLDAQVFMLNKDGKVPNNGYFVFYNQPRSIDGSVFHSGDNVNGEGDGDDESITLNLSNVPSDIERIMFTLTIHDAENRNQSFQGVKNAFVRVVNSKTHIEILRFKLDDMNNETAMVVGEVYRHQGQWKFNAIGSGYRNELIEFCNRFGVVL